MISWLAGLMAPLNTVLFHLGNDAVTWAELLGFLSGGLAVWLTVRAHVANFPIGIANSAFFLVLFVSTRLWASAGLQVVFIALGVAGWWAWVRGGPERSPLVVGRASTELVVACLVFVALGTVALTLVLREAADPAPFWDALVTALSLAAQWLLNAKKVQTWWFWIAADCVSVPLYLFQRLDLTAVVYVLFLGMCVAGLIGWRRELARPTPVAVPI